MSAYLSDTSQYRLPDCMRITWTIVLRTVDARELAHLRRKVLIFLHRSGRGAREPMMNTLAAL